jgi:hypothetical protein
MIKFPSYTVQSTRDIHELIKKVRSISLLLEMKPARKCCALTEEKVDEIEARLEHTT